MNAADCSRRGVRGPASGALGGVGVGGRVSALGRELRGGGGDGVLSCAVLPRTDGIPDDGDAARTEVPPPRRAAPLHQSTLALRPIHPHSLPLTPRKGGVPPNLWSSILSQWGTLLILDLYCLPEIKSWLHNCLKPWPLRSYCPPDLSVHTTRTHGKLLFSSNEYARHSKASLPTVPSST